MGARRNKFHQIRNRAILGPNRFRVPQESDFANKESEGSLIQTNYLNRVDLSKAS